MSRNTRRALSILTALVILSAPWAARDSRASLRAGAGQKKVPPASPCADALTWGFVCVSANERALEVMNAGGFEAFTVSQDVSTGALVAFAASRPSSLDVTTQVLPLSVSKLLLAASWWDNRRPETSFESTRGSATSANPAYRSRVSVHEMLVGGSDSAGRQAAVALRRSVGAGKVLGDFARYGFGPRADSPRDEAFWAALAPRWRERLTPAPSYASLSAATKDAEWGDTLSLGEANMLVTGLHVSRFLQAVGNGGVMVRPSALEHIPRAQLWRSRSVTRVMQRRTALRLQSAMRDTVERGTARSVADALEETGWRLGGKTGTGPGPDPIGPESDGWFAGLIFDPQGRARFTVATFVRRGGPGGGNAAKISAELARHLIGAGKR